MFDFEGLYTKMKKEGRTLPTDYGEYAVLHPSDKDIIPREFRKENGELMSFGVGYPVGFHDCRIKGKSYVFMPINSDWDIAGPKIVYHDVEARTGSQERASRMAFKVAASLGDDVLKKFTFDWIDNNIVALVRASPEQKEFLQELPLPAKEILKKYEFM